MIKSALIAVLFSGLALAAFAQPDDIPFAQPGTCYAKCYVPDKYEIVTDQVSIRRESTEPVVSPARFETKTAYVPAKEAYTRLVVEPAEFDTVTERIMVRPPGKHLPASAYDTVVDTILIKPATKQYTVTQARFEQAMAPAVVEEAYLVLEIRPQQYEEVPDRVEIRPASTRWIRKKANRDCLGAEPDDCFVWCLVEEPAQYQTFYKKEPRGCGSGNSDDCVLTTPVAAKTAQFPLQKVNAPGKVTESVSPAEYKTVTRQVLKANASAPEGNEPGEYTTITRQVLRKPARVREEFVPTEYQTIKRKVVKTPAKIVYEPLPAEYAPVIKRKLVRKGGFSAWREILCGEKLTGYTIRQVQDALNALGYLKGVSETNLGPRTKAAIIQFQQDRELPADGNLDFETLQALGVSY